VGAFGGYSEINLSKSDFNNAALESMGLTGSTITASDTDKHGTPYGLVGGFQLMRFFAIEASLIDLGKATASASGTGPGGAGTLSLNGDVKSRGGTLELVGILPLPHIQIDGRIGGYYGTTKATFSAAVNGVGSSTEVSKSNASLMAGVGLAWVFNDYWSLRLDYLYFDRVGESETAGPLSVNAVTLGVRFHIL
jgi:opacity protein-like surface antigen